MFTSLRTLVVALACAVGAISPITSAQAEDGDISVALISGNIRAASRLAIGENGSA